MKEIFNNLKKEYSMIVLPGIAEVVYTSLLVIIISFLVSLLIVAVDSVIGSVINSILFS